MKKKFTVLAMALGFVCLLFAGNLNSKTVAVESSHISTYDECDQVFWITYDRVYRDVLLATGNAVWADIMAEIVADQAEKDCRALEGGGF